MQWTLFFIATLWFTVSGSWVDPDPEEYGILEQAALRNNTHNLVVGWRQYGDRLLLKDSVNEKYSFGRIITEDIQYPAKGKKSDVKITFILARDLGSGSGYANITAGGLGENNVKIRLKSKRSRGLHFKVEVYGKE